MRREGPGDIMPGAMEILAILALLAQNDVQGGVTQRGAPSSGIPPTTALLIAVTAAGVSTFLTFLGGLVNDYFAARRENRRQQHEDAQEGRRHKREDAQRQADREREDHISKEHQEREDTLRVRAGRLQACQRFVDNSNTLIPGAPIR